jgi:N6-L-threonylcarbamoyladenine synthase
VYRALAKTRDDAAGEAFDKIAKLLGLGYPGGPAIDRLSEGADERAFDFPRAVMKNHSLDFSFSGQKSEARRQAARLGIVRAQATGAEPDALVRNFVASFQRAVVEPLVDNTLRACRREGVRTVLLAGGVACNRRLRSAFQDASHALGFRVFMPSPKYTTDNAAMIGEAAFLHLDRKDFASDDLCADPALKLGA